MSIESIGGIETILANAIMSESQKAKVVELAKWTPENAQKIRLDAYFIFCRTGRRDAVANWLEAEKNFASTPEVSNLVHEENLVKDKLGEALRVAIVTKNAKLEALLQQALVEADKIV